MHLGLDTIGKGLNPLPTSPSKGSRRCSVVDILTQPTLITSSSASKSKSPKPGKKIFNKLGSEMVGIPRYLGEARNDIMLYHDTCISGTFATQCGRGSLILFDLPLSFFVNSFTKKDRKDLSLSGVWI